jgi:hypothetical protein
MAASALLGPALASLQSAVQRVSSTIASHTVTSGSGGTGQQLSLHTLCPYLNPAIDRVAVLFAHFACRKSVANMLGRC